MNITFYLIVRKIKLRDKLYVSINDQITKAMFHQIDKIEKGQFLLNPENFPPHPVNFS